MGLVKAQRSELTDRLRRFFGLVGGYDSTLETVINPVVQLQDLSAVPYRQSVQGFMAGSSLAAAVGAKNFLLISNPVGGPPIVVIDEIRAWSASAETAFIVQGTVPAGAVATPTYATDNLPPGSGALYAPVELAPRLQTGNTIAGPFTITAIGRLGITAGVEAIYKLPLGIAPGGAVGIWGATNNVTLAANFSGRVFSDPSLLSNR